MELNQYFSLADRVAIVTGAGRGIGRSIALTFAEAGADVLIAARTKTELDSVADKVAAFGRRAVAVTCDVRNLDSLPELVERAMSELGGVDIVVNNAGGAYPRPFLDTSPSTLEAAFHFNVTTAFELSRLAVPRMLEGGGGAIVNISSAMGRLSDRGFVAYGTAKAALAHLTRLLATDCAPRVRVNAIAVGSAATSALESVLADDATRAEMEAKVPLRRLGRPEDVALGALYLCSPAADYVTGKVLEIDGGMEAPNLDLHLPDLR